MLCYAARKICNFQRFEEMGSMRNDFFENPITLAYFSLSRCSNYVLVSFQNLVLELQGPRWLLFVKKMKTLHLFLSITMAVR